MLVVTLDANVVHDLGRGIGKKTSRNEIKRTDLDKKVLDGILKISIDSKKYLCDHWIQSTSEFYVQEVLTLWGENGGLYYVEYLGVISEKDSNQLKNLGFPDGTDKFIVRVALRTPNKIVVSRDKHFWDPKEKNEKKWKGNPNAPVAKYLLDELGISVLLLKQLLKKC